ncbi:MAG: hypothetical protein CVT88_00050 [Candidatus Altiarchaeales archaeon HGW-Altiarchaeales-1]|nr:MAG: hypothetical protein CVT88_00050 [Candidatus Altiarchaeales archaeon HGW-Altiarchaeales-1]
MSKILNFGLGQAGINLALNIYKEAGRPETSSLENIGFFIGDIQPIETSQETHKEAKRLGLDLERLFGHKKSILFPTAACLNQIQITSENYEYVRRSWLISGKIAEDFLNGEKSKEDNKFYGKDGIINRIKTINTDDLWINIVNAGGGGTGVGCGHLFGEKIRKDMNKKPGSILTTTIVLPYKNEEHSIMSEVNAICNIGLCHKTSDAIIIADNEYMEKREKVNEMYGKWTANLTECNIPNLHEFFKRTGNNKKPPVIVPSFVEKDKDFWDTLKLEFLIEDALYEGKMADCDLEKSMEIYIDVTLPNNYKEKITGRELEQKIEEDMKKNGKNIKVTIDIKKPRSNKLKICSFIALSNTPRLNELNEIFGEFIANEEKMNEILNKCNSSNITISLEELEKIYKNLKDDIDEFLKE